MFIYRHSTPLLALVACLLLGFQTAYSQTGPSIPVGQVEEKVVVQAHPDQSYAVFLPPGYAPDKAWPTVFCLDPRARGKSAIDKFVPGATKYGYIILCSNDSRNGLNWSIVTNIFSNWWEDAHLRFSIDDRRTYAAGFSGGSRLAATYASRCRGCLAGVIGCGAGFPGDIAPDDKTLFSYFGIVGVDDFNFGEMSQLENKLSKLHAPFLFESFPGGHEWPPQENIAHALAWFALQAMRAGVLTKDSAFIEQQLTERMSAAEQLLTSQQLPDAYGAFTAIVRDFQDLKDIKVAADKAAQLGRSNELKKQVRAEQDLYDRQLRAVGEIRQLWMKKANPEEAGGGRSEASAKLSEWKKKKALPTDSRDRRLARRIISHLQIESYETAQASLRANNYDLALANFQLIKELDPRSANVHYEIARVYSLKHQKKSAIQSLEAAISLGFKDSSRIKADEVFAELANEPRFQKLIANLDGQ